VLDTVLGLVVMALWIVAVIAFASGVTYVVVKLSPGDDTKPKPET
jgi:hypothetical protein